MKKKKKKKKKIFYITRKLLSFACEKIFSLQGGEFW